MLYTWEARQKDYPEIKATLGYIARLYLNKQEQRSKREKVVHRWGLRGVHVLCFRLSRAELGLSQDVAQSAVSYAQVPCSWHGRDCLGGAVVLGS